MEKELDWAWSGVLGCVYTGCVISHVYGLFVEGMVLDVTLGSGILCLIYHLAVVAMVWLGVLREQLSHCRLQTVDVHVGQGGPLGVMRRFYRLIPISSVHGADYLITVAEAEALLGVAGNWEIVHLDLFRDLVC